MSTLKRKTNKPLWKKVIAWLHLWPSLISSVILIVVCVTGTIVVYCDEIIDFASRDVLYVPEVKGQRIPAEELLANYKKIFPERRSPSYMIVYRDPARSVKFNNFDPKNGLSFVYMDPYTGKVLREDHTIHFFFVTAHLHGSLLLGKTGEWIVAVATIIFLIGLITGLVLWWPKKWNSSTRKSSFTIRWKARLKRANYDLHNVLGFYSLSIALVLTVTGLIIAFHPLAEWTISAFGGDPTHAWEERLLPQYQAKRQTASFQPAIDRYLTRDPEAIATIIYTYNIDSAGHYMLVAASQVGLKSYVGDAFFIDKYSGKEVDVPKEAMLHEKVENSYWTLHMGAWMGWLGKLVTFIAGLVSTSLPITGFIIWWGRRKKPNNRKNTEFLNNKTIKPMTATVQ